MAGGRGTGERFSLVNFHRAGRFGFSGELCEGRLDFERAAEAVAAVFRLVAPTRVGSRRLGETNGGENIKRGHAGDGGDGEREAAAIGVASIGVVGEAQQREVHHVTGDARPDEAGGFGAGENAETAGDLASAEGAEEVVVLFTDADGASEFARREEFGEAETDAEPTEVARKVRCVHRSVSSREAVFKMGETLQRLVLGSTAAAASTG